MMVYNVEALFYIVVAIFYVCVQTYLHSFPVHLLLAKPVSTSSLPTIKTSTQRRKHPIENIEQTSETS